MHPKYPEALAFLIAYFKKLPGVGTRTAERFAFELLHWKPEALQEWGEKLRLLPRTVIPCVTCGCLTEEGMCQFCRSSVRDPSLLCILSSPRDVYAVEETKAFRGLYHVIEHLLSPLDGRHATSLRLDRIEQRLEQHPIREVVLAFDSTLEGDTTALYLKQELSKNRSLTITRLGFGLPMGSSLEYIDGSTLAKALAGRQAV